MTEGVRFLRGWMLVPGTIHATMSWLCVQDAKAIFAKEDEEDADDGAAKGGG